MEQADLRLWESRCTQENWAQCQAHCPLHVNVRDFIAQMQAGKYQAARAILERHMPFPVLLSHICDHVCENACLRKDLGGSIAIGELERNCIKLADKAGKLLLRAPKNKKVAILGSGLAALTVAWDLSAKAYQVEIFHNEPCVHDFLSKALNKLNLPNNLPNNLLIDEFNTLSQRGVLFSQRIISPELLDAVSIYTKNGQQQENPEQLEYHAVFIDAACAPELCPDRELINLVTASKDGQEALCFGGWLNPIIGTKMGTNNINVSANLEYQSVIGSVFEGRKAAITFDRFLTGTSVFASREAENSCQSKLFTNTHGLEKLAPVLKNVQNKYYSVEEITAESARCLQCQCLECVKKCVYLQEYKSYPRVYARQIYNNAAIVKGVHQSNSLINSCTLCGQCTVLCPEDFSMADLCLSARQDMVETNKMPASAHEFAIDDMQASNSPECSIALGAPSSMRAGENLAATEACESLFFPGCQLAALRSEAVLKVFKHLQTSLKGRVGIYLKCCGIPAHWAGQKELFQQNLNEFLTQWQRLGKARLIVACASCLKIFQEHLPEVPVVSLWEVLNAEAKLPAPQNIRADFLKTLCIHDPCSARHNLKWQEAVRQLLHTAKIDLIEPTLTAETTSCCGYGGLVSNANPKMAAKIAGQRALELSPELLGAAQNYDNTPALVSCIMCRKHLVDAGKASFHILDIILDSEALSLEAGLQKELGLSARRQQRAALKRKILQELYAQTVPEPKAAEFQIILDAELLEQLENQHILQEDIEAVINYVHNGGQCFYEQESRHFVACLRPVRVTYWVRYSKSDNTYTIHDAYCHRMQIPMCNTQRG